MQSKKMIIICVMIIAMMFASGCISEEDEVTPAPTTTPAPDTFFLVVNVDGENLQDVGLSEIKSLTYQHIDAVMVKKTGEEVDTSWGGTSFYGFMEYLGVENISEVTLIALDGYERTLEYAQLQQALLAWEDEAGAEIAVEDGGPIRFVAPGLPSNTWMQNLIEINVTTAPADTFFLSVSLDGAAYQDVGLSVIKSLTYENKEVTMTKKSGEEVVSRWGGTSFYGFMEYLGISGISQVTLVASDGYEKTLDYAVLSESMLAWEDETGAEIAVDDGGPIRFIAPGQSSSAWIQNLAEIRVTTQ